MKKNAPSEFIEFLAANWTVAKPFIGVYVISLIFSFCHVVHNYSFISQEKIRGTGHQGSKEEKIDRVA
jgi:hypothetical protein